MLKFTLVKMSDMPCVLVCVLFNVQVETTTNPTYTQGNITKNYFERNNTIYQPTKGVAMGSPISGLIAEIFLQYSENLIFKHHIENKSLIFYTRYTADILIIYDQTRIKHTQILQQANTIPNNLTFNHTLEADSSINVSDLLIHRINTNTETEIYRKPTTTNMIIHFTSNHPHEHKIAAFRFLLTRMQHLPLTLHYKQKEWRKVLLVAKTNGYPLSTITKFNTEIQNKLHNSNVINEHSNKKWTTFTFHSPMICKITNLFHDTNLKIAFHTNNLIQNILNTPNQNKNKYTYSGIYQMICHTCSNSYTGQRGTDWIYDIRST
jgi:hypothetical protein